MDRDLYNALKKAEVVTLRKAPDQDGMTLTTRREGKNHEIRAEFPVEYRIEDWSRGNPDRSIPSGKIHWYLSSLKFVEEWQTFLYFLKSSDEIKFILTIGNNSPAMKEAGFSHDQVKIQVKRGEKRLVFAIDDIVHQVDHCLGLIQPQS